jgi:hypothetical protein
VKSVGRFGYWALVLLGVLAFWWAASVHAAAVNRSTGKDQGAYVALADRMARKHALEVDGARPPLYPALLTLARQAGEDRETFFRRARTSPSCSRRSHGSPFFSCCAAGFVPPRRSPYGSRSAFRSGFSTHRT